MADISLIELGVYAFICYASMLMLIISTIKEVPMTKALSIVRAIYLIPGVIAAAILTQVGPNIIMPSVTNTILAVNTTEIFEETIDAQIVLQSEVWSLFHFMIMLVMVVYVITQFLLLLTSHE